MQEFYHEFFLKLHNGRISLARLDKLVDKLWVLVKVDQSKYGNLEITINMIKKVLPQQTIISKINAQLETH